MIFTTFSSYFTNKTELPCANSRYSQCLNCFSYLLPAVHCSFPLCALLRKNSSCWHKLSCPRDILLSNSKMGLHAFACKGVLLRRFCFVLFVFFLVFFVSTSRAGRRNKKQFWFKLSFLSDNHIPQGKF